MASPPRDEPGSIGATTASTGADAGDWSVSGLRHDSVLRVNPTMYRACGRIRCWVKDARLSISPDPHVEATLARASGGAPAGVLAAALVADDPAIARDEADAFVAQLCRMGLLVEQERVAPRLGAGSPEADVVPLDETPLDGPQRQRLLDAISILHRLHAGEEPLDRFIVAFAARFGDEEVPLLVALDDEAGVGGALGASSAVPPLLAGLVIEPPASRFGPLVERLAAATRELALEPADVAHLTAARPLPAAYIASIRLGEPLVLDEVVALAPPPTDPPLPLEDLTLGLEYERLTVRSRRLGREVHPAVDPRNPPIVTELLRALPHQGTVGRLAFDWGALSSSSPPLVTAAGVVLSTPRMSTPPADVPRLRVRVGVPVQPPPGKRPSLPQARVLRPGSEWLQVKLYGAETTADSLLLELVAPWIMRGRSAGDIAHWYFYRAADPRPHLRVRVHGRAPLSLVPELERWTAPFHGDGRLAGWELSSFAREIGRYGGDEGMLIAERIFEHDSDAVVELLGLLDLEAGAEARWRLVLVGLDALARDLGVDPLVAVSAAQASHFAVDESVRSQVATRVAALGDELATLLQRPSDHELSPGFDVFSRRATAIAPLASELRRHLAEGRLSRTIIEQAPSYLHMFANRCLQTASLQQELVVYELLRRLLGQLPVQATAGLPAITPRR